MENNKNIACRLFKEQIDLVQQLPEKERAEVLYKAILTGFNQIENQNENQNENAYVSDSVSVLGKTVYSLLVKNIVWKEFSNNYGGKRAGAGAKKRQPEEPPIKLGSSKTVEEILNETGRQLSRRANSHLITPDFVFPKNQYFDAYRKELPTATSKTEQWLRRSNLVGKQITETKLGQIIQKFATKK